MKTRLTILLLLCMAHVALADLPPELTAKIDERVQAAIDQVQAPSASVAIVLDGKITCLKAYGKARLATAESQELAATTQTRYAIGSVSKQIVAAAVLLCVQDGKLKLDEPVGKYLAGLTDGDKIMIRHLLNHTSGYRDYYPQDYVFPAMKLPIQPSGILDQWARLPLDFPSGEQWQYSNTGYTAAGLVVEKVTGQPLFKFMQDRIFQPLEMSQVIDHDTQPLASPDAVGYTRVALGPVRLATKEGEGWLFAAGPLAMPPSDLAKWNISVMNQSLLSVESYSEMTKVVEVPKNPRNLRYGLGVHVGKDDAGRRVISHGGGVAGSTTENRIWPEQKAAISVVVNGDWAALPSAIADRIRDLVLPTEKETAAAALAGPDAEVQAMFAALQQGRIDSAKLTPNAQAYFHEQALRDAAEGLGRLGAVQNFKRTAEGLRGGLDYRTYRVVCEQGTVTVIVRSQPDGRYEQFMVDAEVR